ncbi:copper-translocating P-type ATPase [Virgibacillus profundi]|uniref:Cd(2+)-exporting ATPase n=1 Tax=Virgibacillus profundi TaxID=2024555 RepID=A0A2A2IHB1_9BACI|nr:cation-translocating P-type ATPase [Virgibacillus profundi]PAV30540.1 copper-translocating P-type ATPase [Virgibacillus profundi]PXY54712.1 copper-translocating P-type ATPase [Virgibacillus profundi]
MGKIKKIHVVIVSGILLALALMFHFLDMEIWKNTALIAGTFVAGYSIAKKAIQSVMMKAFSIELLVTIAVIGALIIGEYVESAAVTFLFLFGAYLEARTLEKTRSSLRTLMDMAPLEATVLKNGERVIMPVGDIEEGDRILIQSGEKVAIDGRIVSGQAFINEAAITGESVPASKKLKDQVFSGTIIDNGYVEVEAEKVGDDTTFAKIIELVEEAQEAKAKTQKFLERFANVYTPAILVLSVLVFVFTQNVELAITFLVIACPGALVISAPVSLVAGIGNGAKNGTLLKGGEVMENLAKIDVIVFDKTGTLTKGKPAVTGMKAFGMKEEELLKITAEAEIISEHHLGRTIVNEAEHRGLTLTNEPEDFTVEKGHGLYATVAGKSVVIGNRKLLSKNGIQLPGNIESYAIQEEKNGNTAIFVGIDNKLAGVISIADQIRAKAADAIRQLKAAGVKHTVMLTGDNTHTAEKVARQLGIDQVFAEMLPEDKVNHIKRLKAEGYRVAMVGDGINDAPAIALADVGMAMGAAGTDAAMETADVVLMADKLSKIPYAYSLAKATVRNMKQNMFFAVGTVALLLVGVLLGKIFLASGMLIHELSVLIVILNAIRLVRYKQREQGEVKEMRAAIPETK